MKRMNRMNRLIEMYKTIQPAISPSVELDREYVKTTIVQRFKQLRYEDVYTLQDFYEKYGEMHTDDELLTLLIWRTMTIDGGWFKSGIKYVNDGNWGDL